MNIDYLEQLKETELDHLMDAQKSINRANMFKHRGNTEAMEFFIKDAKNRLASYDEVYAKTSNILGTMQKASEDTAESVLVKILCKQNIDWATRMKNIVGTWL